MRRTSRTRMDAIRHRLNTEQPIFLLSCVDQHILEGMFTCAPCKRLDHLNLLKRNGSVHTGRRTVSSLHGSATTGDYHGSLDCGVVVR